MDHQGRALIAGQAHPLPDTHSGIDGQGSITRDDENMAEGNNIVAYGAACALPERAQERHEALALGTSGRIDEAGEVAAPRV